MPSLICVPILVHDLQAAIDDSFAARDGGADLVEFRIDDFFTGDLENASEENGIRSLIEASPLPCIVTCRLAEESGGGGTGGAGGGYQGDEMSRISLYERLVFGQTGTRTPRYIDVEMAAYKRSANIKQKVNLAVEHPEQLRDVQTGLILSMHDFSGRPEDLTRRVLALKQEPAAAVVKIAYRARSLRDSLELLELPSLLERPTIALGMGEFGLISRLLAPKFGAFLTFAALRPASTTAPGQPTLKELTQTYRFRAIRPNTQIYGIVGWPVTHSRSPQTHNAWFDALGINAVYVPLPIAAGEDAESNYASFKATILELIEHPKLDLCGVSITIPHKESASRLAIEQSWELEAMARAIGAANTLHIERKDGKPTRVRVLNTDAPALVACIEEVSGSLVGKRVAIIGAGGVARAGAYACASAGATVIIYNRDPQKARSLASSLTKSLEAQPSNPSCEYGKVVAAELALLPRACCDVLINCTPIGMEGGPVPQGLAAPLSEMTACPKDLVVMDTVYTPRETPLIKEAMRLNLRTITGDGMFLKQAAMQFEAWTGKRPPTMS